jgi:hypothetical protein
MKHLLVLLACLLAVPAQGQILSIIMGGTNQPAATPTFSPAAGAVANPTTVTASTATSDGCTIYFDTSNPPATAQTTYSVTTGVTLYAQARGCAHHRDSAVGSATYTISTTINSMITSAPTGTPKNNYTGSIGMYFIANAVTVTQLCMKYISGNSQSHLISIYSSIGPTLVASVSINTATAPILTDTNGLTWQCSSTTTAGTLPATLSLGGNYYVQACYVSGGDVWFDLQAYTYDSTFASSLVGNVVGASCGSAGSPGAGGQMYVPVSITR